MDPASALHLVRPAVRRMAGYVPGLQPRPGQRLVKLNTNENPFPPSPRVIAALREATGDSLRLYPSPAGDALRGQAARTYGLAPDQVLCGNGSDEVLAMLMRTFVGEGEAIAYFRPSYSLYPVLAGIAAAKTIEVPLARPAGRAAIDAVPVPCPDAKVFFLTTPNSPYGFAFPTAWIARLLAAFPGIVVADEAYVDFARESALPLLAESPRLVVVRSLSKAYSLAGMRIGLALAHPAVVAEMDKVKDSYNVSRLAQAAASAALADEAYVDFARDSALPLLAENPRLVVVRSLSKAYSLAGMRIGLALAHPAVVAEMDKVKDSYNVSRLAQAAASAALADEAYLRETRDAVLEIRQSLVKQLGEMGFAVLPSDANFVFAVPPAGIAARVLYDGLLARGFLVRHFGTSELADGLRISIGTREEMAALAGAAGEIIHGSQ